MLDDILSMNIIIQFDLLHNGVYPELFDPELHRRTNDFARWAMEVLMADDCDRDCANCTREQAPEDPVELVRDVYEVINGQVGDPRRN